MGCACVSVAERFLTWEWFEAWWAHFGEGHELRVATCTAPDGRVVAILPLYLARRRPRLFRLVGHSVSGALGVVCAPEDLPESTAAVLASLPDLGCDVLLADGVAGGAALRGRTLLRVPCPVITLTFSSWDDYPRRAARTSASSSGARRRKLASGTSCRRLVGGSPRLSPTTCGCCSRFTSSVGAATISLRRQPGQRSTRSRARRRRPRLAALLVSRARGVPVAAWYGFRFGGIET